MILEDTDTNPLAIVPLTADTMRGLIRNEGFDVGRVRFSVKNKLLPTQIYLYFGKVSKYPISGFPRCFTEDSRVTSPRYMAPSGLFNSSSCRYTHGSRRRKGTASSWKPPDIRTAPTFSNLRHFSSHPDRILGHDIINSEEEETSNSVDPPINLLQQDQTSSPVEEERRWNVREAFRALLGPLWMQRSEEEVPRAASPVPVPVPRYIGEWLQQCRTISTNSIHSAAVANIPREEFAMSLQQYNVNPEEYAVYEQWVGLLQPNLKSQGDYWLPPVDAHTSEFARSPSQGEIYELHDTQMAAELDGISFI